MNNLNSQANFDKKTWLLAAILILSSLSLFANGEYETAAPAQSNGNGAVTGTEVSGGSMYNQYDGILPPPSKPFRYVLEGGYAGKSFSGSDFADNVDDLSGDAVTGNNMFASFDMNFEIAEYPFGGNLELNLGLLNYSFGGDLGGFTYDETSITYKGSSLSETIELGFVQDVGFGQIQAFVGPVITEDFFSTRTDDTKTASHTNSVSGTNVSLGVNLSGGYRIPWGDDHFVALNAGYRFPLGNLHSQVDMINVESILTQEFTVGIQVGFNLTGTGSQDRTSPLRVTPDWGVVSTPGVEIIAEDKSFHYVTDERFGGFMAIDSWGYHLHNASHDVKDEWQTALSLGAIRVRVITPYKEEPLYGVLLLNKIDYRAEGAVTRSYSIRIPEHYVEKTDAGKISVVYEPYKFTGSNKVNAEPKAWILWLSEIPF